jgi:ketosteroid isomerase-like protein
MFLLAGLVAMCAAMPALAAEDVAQHIIAIERAALDGSDRGDIAAFLKLSVPDVVYQDPWQEKPMVGIADLTAYYAKVFKPEEKPTLAGEMLNTRVQVMGDAAVLTFNYIVRKRDTHAVVRRWNAVEVYNKRDGEWRIVNTQWAYTLGEPAKE